MTNYQGFIADRIRRVPVSGLHSFFGIAASMPDVISLGVGEPDFPTPSPITKAGFDAVYDRAIGYTANAGLLELRKAISENLEKLYGVSYDPDSEILVTVGVSEGFKCVFTAMIDEGDEVIVPHPCFVAYEPEIIFAGGNPVPVVTRAENAFEPLAEDIEAAITERTKAIFIGFPNNPTGAVLSRQNALEIARVAEENELVVISDEIYDRLVYSEPHLCFPALPGMRDRTVLMGGFSKDYAMTGWRVGYVCANPELLAAFSKVHQYAVMSAPTISQFAALAAIEQGEPFVGRMREEYDRRRKMVISELNEMGLDCFEPKGAFYAFPSVAMTGLNGDEFAHRLLMEEQVAVVPGSSFGLGGGDHVRIAYCKSYEEIELAFNRIRSFLDRI
ncbi:MAG: aminotransferase class I/II-fold pyridoxal phosphate-dependent enzyme [Acidobacteria bacterium]|nr:MAG: aminotransferase class I/II-fold pyridoxal phosphate-dependent enzyme [Acidobacteriota bacterium]REK02772.1 MAG: aminotransferase class I/II-fold pyridoxal phosphate-dependent enzyme [Acidobacteriota bacterium]REK13423.1 MAG: aminotransferase class I/II-fold pyridoxal phosphate-dependent enzyme [Acidobacteriota bacterium]REK41417.1 MAG: aminotransferase class I/II-fold pyridoxal phosphate-dependent enzyme [Acidobacteriota bacterium]